MYPTYSLAEIKSLLRSLNIEETNILQEVLLDEASLYTSFETRAINRMIVLKRRSFMQNQVQLDYLLAYN